MIVCDEHEILKLAVDAVECQITLEQSWGTVQVLAMQGAEGELHLDDDSQVELFFEGIDLEATVDGVTLRDHFENGDPIGVVTTAQYWREALEQWDVNTVDILG